MRKFDEQLLRLKQVLGETRDQAVAERLGLTKAAFSERKRRDAFPKDRLLGFAAEHPELQIDTGFVLTGVPGDSEVVRTASLLHVMQHFGWKSVDLGSRLGVGRDREDDLVRAVHAQDFAIRLQSREMRWLVEEWGVRREFLVNGTGPMLGSGNPTFEMQRLSDRVATLEAQVAELRAVSLQTPKSSAARKRATSTRRSRS